MNIKNFIVNTIFKFKTSRMVGEGIWIASSQLGTAIGVLFLTRLITDMYPPDMFGKANLYLGISTFAYSFFCAPLMWAILRFYPEYVRSGEIVKFRQTIRLALFRTTVLVIAILLACGALYSAVARVSFELFTLLTAIFLVDVIRSHETSFLSAARRQRPNALWSFFDTCSRPLAAIIFGYYFSTTTQSLLIGYLVGSLSVLLIFMMLIKQEGQGNELSSRAPDSMMENALRSYVLPLIPLAVISGVTSLSDRYIIGGILGLEQAGIYIAAYGLIGRPFLISGIIIEQLIRPKYFDDISAGNFALGKKIIKRWLLTTTLVCMLGVLLVAVFKDDITRLFLGEKYRSSAVLMPWIAFGHAFLVISYVYEIMCYAYKQTRSILYIRVSGVIACLTISIPLIFYSGMRGAAISVPLYFGFQLVTAIIITSKITCGAESGKLSKSNI